MAGCSVCISWRNLDIEALRSANTIGSCHGNRILLSTRSMEKIVKQGCKEYVGFSN